MPAKAFRVWRRDEFEGYDEDERADRAWPVERYLLNGIPHTPIDDPKRAATLFADHCHALRDGWEWTWPQEFIVHDGERYWLVEVERETVPEFTAGMPMPFGGSP